MPNKTSTGRVGRTPASEVPERERGRLSPRRASTCHQTLLSNRISPTFWAISSATRPCGDSVGPGCLRADLKAAGLSAAAEVGRVQGVAAPPPPAPSSGSSGTSVLADASLRGRPPLLSPSLSPSLSLRTLGHPAASATAELRPCQGEGRNGLFSQHRVHHGPEL